ncbi:hypothetical protein PT974_06123 [Cladobotryum mycophilum]|uniref:Uncharacterized protein n=1 Tax=Cladobotryum mycophilum TaxID=491253 RepID=A0ABR0SKN7_9HYPO
MPASTGIRYMMGRRDHRPKQRVSGYPFKLDSTRGTSGLSAPQHDWTLRLSKLGGLGGRGGLPAHLQRSVGLLWKPYPALAPPSATGLLLLLGGTPVELATIFL